ncbi:MAG: tripartite tricarboxylate transporter substrate-binding protein [Beijerinckiaceae bacterium]|nr:tripartite tricarboxylate transporter substrate-binding protein [Beijerinckiaceae bacterium]
MLRRQALGVATFAMCAIGATLAVTATAQTARADAVADFYKGKSVQLIVGYGPGGGYDVYARILSRYMSKYIPGNPNIVVQNMPGAGSLVAANYIYNVAPKDGTVFGTFARNMPLLSVLGGNPAVKFDARKFSWLGSASSYQEDSYIMWVRKDATVQSVADAQKPGGPPVVLGGTAEGATGNDVPVILRDALGMNIKQIVGYPDSNAIFLAIERKEVEGRTTDLSAVRTNRPEYLKPDSYVRALLQFGRATRHPDFPDVPTARELAKDEKSRSLIELTELPYVLSRPFVAPPGIPADRAQALEKAFIAAYKDPELVAEANKLGIGVSPIGGKEALALIDKIAAAPQEQRDYVRGLLNESKGAK